MVEDVESALDGVVIDVAQPFFKMKTVQEFDARGPVPYADADARRTSPALERDPRRSSLVRKPSTYAR